MDDDHHHHGGDGYLHHHPAIEVSLTWTLEELRHIAYDATPAPNDLVTAQRALLRTATARLARKGLSTDTETYRRLGILIPHWKHPAQFEAVLHALRDYWQHHNTAISLGRSAPFRRVRTKAANYLRKLARGEEEDEDDNEDEDEDEDGEENGKDCNLPTATMVRVFRLVNGNLEIPATLFKALAMAGRIRDAFFPEEPSTWEQGPGGRGLGVDDDVDALSEASYNGTQTDASTEPSSDAGDDDDDDDVIVIERDDIKEAPHVENRVRQATAQFLQQMQVALVGNNNNNSGNTGGGPFGGMDFSVLPDVVRCMFCFGNSAASASPVSSGSPNVVFCPVPIMVMPMGMGQAGMGQAMMDAMQNMMKQMSGASDGSRTNLRGGGGIGAADRKLLLEIKEDENAPAVNSMKAISAGFTTGTKRAFRAAATDFDSSRKKLKTASPASSSGSDRRKATQSSFKAGGSASSLVSSIVQSTQRLLPTGRMSSTVSPAATTPPRSPASSSQSTIRAAPRPVHQSTPRSVPRPSPRPAASSTISVINASEKRQETFTEWQAKRARKLARKHEKTVKK